MRLSLPQPVQSYKGKKPFDRFINLFFRFFYYSQPEPDILSKGQVGEKGIILKDHGGVTGVWRRFRNILALKDDSSLIRFDKTADCSEKSCFAAAARTDKGNQLALLKRK